MEEVWKTGGNGVLGAPMTLHRLLWVQRAGVGDGSSPSILPGPRTCGSDGLWVKKALVPVQLFPHLESGAHDPIPQGTWVEYTYAYVKVDSTRLYVTS